MPHPPRTARLEFREMTPADLDLMVTLLGDPVVMWVYPHAYSRPEVLDWIERTMALYRERGFGLWLLTLRETGEFVGECGLVPQVVEGRNEVEVGYHILPALWGQGLATEAVTACHDYARDVAGLDRIVALIDPRNVASQHVATKAGLSYERDAMVPGKLLRVYATAL